MYHSDIVLLILQHLLLQQILAYLHLADQIVSADPQTVMLFARVHRIISATLRLVGLNVLPVQSVHQPWHVSTSVVKILVPISAVSEPNAMSKTTTLYVHVLKDTLVILFQDVTLYVSSRSYYFIDSDNFEYSFDKSYSLKKKNNNILFD